MSANRVPGRPARIIVPMPFACVEGGLANRLRTTFSTATRRGPQKLGSLAVTPHQNLWYTSRRPVDRSRTEIVAQVRSQMVNALQSSLQQGTVVQ